MREALSYPLRGEYAEAAVLSAWICIFAHAVVLPVLALVPLLGYAATVIGEGGDDPPPFLYRAVLVRGVCGSVLTVAYGAVPLAIGAVTFWLLAGTGRDPAGAEPLVILAGSTSVLFFLAAGAYLLPVALGNYVRAGSLRAGFSGLAVATRAAYFVGWSSGIALLLTGVAAGTALAGLGGVAVVAGSLVAAYATVAGSRRIGRGYAAAR